MQLKLPQLLSNSWNKIKQGSSARASHISEDDIVVFVLGPTGSGKSWFVREATNSDLVKVSKNSHPCTNQVDAVRCDLADEARRGLKEEGNLKSIVFVDTPSFLTGYDQPDAHEEMKAWLNSNPTVYKSRYMGIIYTHRIETDPTLEPIQPHLREFSTVLRSHAGHFSLRVHIVKSYDSSSARIPITKIEERTSKLDSQMNSLKNWNPGWKFTMHQELFQGAPEVARRTVEELFRDYP